MVGLVLTRHTLSQLLKLPIEGSVDLKWANPWLFQTGQPQGIIFVAITRCPLGRRMVKARKGSIGLTSHLVRVGDQLGLFPSLRVPLIVRCMNSY